MSGISHLVGQIERLIDRARETGDPEATEIALAVLALAEQDVERELAVTRPWADRRQAAMQLRMQLRQLRAGVDEARSFEQLRQEMVEQAQEHVVRDGRLFEVHRFGGRPAAVAQGPDPTGLRTAVLQVLVEAVDPGMTRREILSELHSAGFTAVTSNALGGLLHRMVKDGTLARDNDNKLRLPPVAEEEIRVS